jgi:hypothetical protein
MEEARHCVLLILFFFGCSSQHPSTTLPGCRLARLGDNHLFMPGLQVGPLKPYECDDNADNEAGVRGSQYRLR